MSIFWPNVLVAIVGLLHVLASHLYFSRDKWGIAWPIGWLLVTAACMYGATVNPATAYALFAVMVAIWTVWWVLMHPAVDRNWVAENAHQTTGTIAGNAVALKNVRNFEWKTKRQFVERWEDRVYDLDKLTALDVFVCTWGEPRIAHTVLSFVFADAPPLAVTIETRREVGERWTPLAGFMKGYELIFIAADERDVIRNRINLRGEDVRLYRIWSTPEMRRKLFTGYIEQMNKLASRPRFYNTVFTNCTTEIARLVYTAGHKFPLDWRILVSGYVAAFLYDLELLDRSMPFDALRAKADIRAKSKAANDDLRYSQRIREGLPDPMENSPSATAVETAISSVLDPKT
jgi:hypothetical protein